MPKITKDSLRIQLQKRELSPVYVLAGTETYLRDVAARTISNLSFAEGDLRDFNDNAFSLNDPDAIRTALAAANQLPMMATRRVVTVTEVRVAATAGRDSLKEEHAERIEAYLQDPSPHSTLILVADEWNGVRKVAKLFERAATVVEFGELQDEALWNWVEKEFANRGCRADRAVVRRLTATAGSSLRRLSNEIAKLATAALPRSTISADLVDDLVARAGELNHFALTDHLVAGRGRDALGVSKRILDDGAEPLAILGMLSGNFRRLVMVKEMMAEGVDRAEVVRVLRLRPFEQEKFLAAARRTPLERIREAIEQLAEVDVSIKTSVGGGGKEGSRMLIELLICRLAAAGTGA